MRDDAWQDDLLDTADLGDDDDENECSLGRSLSIGGCTWIAHEANPIAASYVPKDYVGEDNGRHRH